MKKIYSTIMMLAMMVAALSFTACGDDDEEGGSGSKNTEKTITINDRTYYIMGSSVHQGSYYIDLSITVLEEKYSSKGIAMELRIPPSRVSELSVGQVFGYEEITIEEWRGLLEIQLFPPTWNPISGSILIKEIKEAELTIQINNLTIKAESTGTERRINGTVTLQNGRWNNDGPIPFSES